jgi:hypothetical protein
MSRIITFSMKFPVYHPKAGEPTNFVQKLVNAFQEIDTPIFEIDELDLEHCPWDRMGRKYHTIRAGRRWKAGDKFSPRVWSGRPYNSKMVTIAADVEIKKVWDIEVDEDLCIWIYCDNEGDEDILERLAANDGLSLPDLQAWFHKPMAGQIICWSDAVEY